MKAAGVLDEAVAAPEIADLDEAAISHAAAAPEIATLLASPPEWLSGPRDAATWAAPARPADWAAAWAAGAAAAAFAAAQAALPECSAARTRCRR